MESLKGKLEGTLDPVYLPHGRDAASSASVASWTPCHCCPSFKAAGEARNVHMFNKSVPSREKVD